jgi:hypothetical protein
MVPAKEFRDMAELFEERSTDGSARPAFREWSTKSPILKRALASTI